MTFQCLFTRQTGEWLTFWLLLLLYITSNFHLGSPTPVSCFSAGLDSVSSGCVQETNAPGDWVKCSFSSQSLQHLAWLCNCGKPETTIYECLAHCPWWQTYTEATAAVESRTVGSGPSIRAARTKIAHWFTRHCQAQSEALTSAKLYLSLVWNHKMS